MSTPSYPKSVKPCAACGSTMMMISEPISLSDDSPPTATCMNCQAVVELAPERRPGIRVADLSTVCVAFEGRPVPEDGRCEECGSANVGIQGVVGSPFPGADVLDFRCWDCNHKLQATGPVVRTVLEALEASPPIVKPEYN